MDTSNIPSESNGRWSWIKFRLELAGYSFASLARELGMHRSAPKLVKRQRWPLMQEVIANKIGIPAQQIWPERYRPDGQPIVYKRGRKPQIRTNNTPTCQQVNGKTAEKV